MGRALTVEEFRQAGSSRRPRSPITKSEWVVLGAAAPAVMVSPFLLGGMVWWSQMAIASMQALVFMVAILPLTGVEDWRQRLGKLMRFPPFWLGGLFVIYVIIQALNPSWEQVYLDEARYFVAEKKPEYFIAWLPQSMNTNFYVMNAWRMVIFWAGAWAFTCALWMSLNTRRAWMALGWMALVTAAVLSLASVAHHLSGNEDLFWIAQFKKNSGAFGPFVYRNQGAAYLYLSMGLGLAMFLHLLRRGEVRSGLPWMALALSFMCLVGIVLNASRGGWLGAGAVLLVFIIMLPFSIRWADVSSCGALTGSLAILLAMCSLGFWIAKAMDFQEIEKKWKSLSSGDDVSFRSRYKLSQATWDMFEDRMLLGWGAGSFYYKFPYYGKPYPEIYFVGRPGWKNYGKQILKYKQAHNDLLQILAEYGVVGFLLLALCVFYWLGLHFMTFFSGKVECVVVFGVSAIFLVHNLGDFFIMNSILLENWCLLLAIMCGVNQAGVWRFRVSS